MWSKALLSLGWKSALASADHNFLSLLMGVTAAALRQQMLEMQIQLLVAHALLDLACTFCGLVGASDRYRLLTGIGNDILYYV